MKPRNWSEVKRERYASDPERLARIEHSARNEVVALNLAELRRELGLTQAEVSTAADITQGTLSRLEHQDDLLLSTLRRVVHALGGEVEISAIVRGKRIRLSF